MTSRRPQEQKTEIGRRLRAAREALDLTQADLCRKFNVATNTYNQWEKGHITADVLTLVRIADRYNITLDWFFRGELGGIRHDLAVKIEEQFNQMNNNTPKTLRGRKKSYSGG